MKGSKLNRRIRRVYRDIARAKDAEVDAKQVTPNSKRVN